MIKEVCSTNKCYTLACYCFLLAVLYFVDLTICGAVPNYIGILFLLSIPVTCIVWGRLYYKVFSIDEADVLSIESCLIAGFWLISLVVTFFIFCLPRLANMIVLYTIMCAVALCLLVFKRKTVYPVYLTPSSIGLLVIAGLATSLWSQTGIIQNIVCGPKIIFLPWSDHFLHSEMIQRLYENSMLGRSQEFSMMSGIPAPLYHYASYIFSSLLRSMTDVPSINISTAFWLPFGGLISGIGAFVFGNLMWGKKEGLFCALAITLLPDPYSLGCGSGYFSYHFLGQAGAAHYYANGISAVSLGLLAQGISKKEVRIILAGLVMICTVIFFKAHVFVVVFPAACFWLILSFPQLPVIKRLIGILSLGVVLGLATLLAWSCSYISLGRPWAMEFFRNIFSSGVLRTTIFSLSQRTSAQLDDLIVGTLLIWGGAFGPMLILAVILICYLIKKGLKNFKDAVPFLFLFFWTALFLLLPANTANFMGTVDEFHHRPFHVVYYFLVVWLIGRFSNLLIEQNSWISRKCDLMNPRIELMLWAISLFLLVIPLKLGKNALIVGSWTYSHQNLNIDIGFWKTAEFVRHHGKLGDILLDSSGDNYFDIVGGIGERRPFLSEPYGRWISEDSPAFGLIKERREIHNALKECVSQECIGRIAQQNNINWYLLHPGDKILWSEEALRKSLFESNGYRVFDIYRFGNSPPDATISCLNRSLNQP